MAELRWRREERFSPRLKEAWAPFAVVVAIVAAVSGIWTKGFHLFETRVEAKTQADSEHATLTEVSTHVQEIDARLGRVEGKMDLLWDGQRDVREDLRALAIGHPLPPLPSPAVTPYRGTP